MTDTHPTGDQHWATVPACLPARYCLLACPPSRSPYPLTHLPACSLLLACLLTCLLACLPARPTTHPPACLLTIACLLACCFVLSSLLIAGIFGAEYLIPLITRSTCFIGRQIWESGQRRTLTQSRRANIWYRKKSTTMHHEIKSYFIKW